MYRGLILYKHSESELLPDDYEMLRFIEECRKDSSLDLTVVSPDVIDLIVTRDDTKSIRISGNVVPLPDFVLPRLGSGTSYFALATIRQFERLGCRVFNNAESIELCKDKLYTQQVLAQSGLPFAHTMLVRFPINMELVENQFSFPVVVKTIQGSYGRGVFLCETPKKFAELMTMLEASASSVNLIIQEYIEETHGSDLRVFTIGGEVLACMKRIAPEGEFKANYTSGAAVEAYPTTQEISWIASEISRIFHLDVAGIDLLFTNDGFTVCEVNSAPGFKGLESCTEVNVPEAIYRYIKLVTHT